MRSVRGTALVLSQNLQDEYRRLILRAASEFTALPRPESPQELTERTSQAKALKIKMRCIASAARHSQHNPTAHAKLLATTREFTERAPLDENMPKRSIEFRLLIDDIIVSANRDN